MDLLLFPEMSMTGFSMHPEKIGEERGNFATLEHFRERAKAYGMYVGVGYVEYRQPKSYNCYAILGPEGELLADYRKIHPFTFGTESVHYTGGEEIVRVKDEVAVKVVVSIRLAEVGEEEVPVSYTHLTLPTTASGGWGVGGGGAGG